MTERRPGRGTTAREATHDGSRGPGGRFAALGAALRGSDGVVLAVAAMGALAALLMVLTEFLTVASVDVASGSCEVINDSNPELADRCSLSGFERHGGALLLFAVLTLAMTLGASVGGSRPAAFALVGVGVLVLAFALGADLPEAGKTGAIGRNFQGATASPGPGLYTELAAGLLAAGAGILRLVRGTAPTLGGG